MSWGIVICVFVLLTGVFTITLASMERLSAFLDKIAERFVQIFLQGAVLLLAESTCAERSKDCRACHDYGGGRNSR